MSNNLSDLLDFIYIKIKCTIISLKWFSKGKHYPLINPNNFISYSPIVEQLVLLGTKYFGRHFSVTSKQINVNQALTSSQ
jgi:hypothetical protein